MFIKWHEGLLTGIEFIDKEHKEILIQEEKIHQLLIEGHTEAYLQGLVGLLMDYVNRHLTHEEELQQVIGYHLFEDHRAHHDAFRQRVENIKERLHHELFSREELLVLDDEINNWLINHIEVEDMKIVDYYDYRKHNQLNF